MKREGAVRGCSDRCRGKGEGCAQSRTQPFRWLHLPVELNVCRAMERNQWAAGGAFPVRARSRNGRTIRERLAHLEVAGA
jgi:hypothetical protein